MVLWLSKAQGWSRTAWQRQDACKVRSPPYLYELQRRHTHGAVQGSMPCMPIAGGGAPPPHAPPSGYPTYGAGLHVFFLVLRLPKPNYICPVFRCVLGGAWWGGAPPPANDKHVLEPWTVPYALYACVYLPHPKAKCPLGGAWGDGAPPPANDKHVLEPWTVPYALYACVYLPHPKAKCPLGGAWGDGAPPPANVEPVRRGFHIAGGVSRTGPVCPWSTVPRHSLHLGLLHFACIQAGVPGIFLVRNC